MQEGRQEGWQEGSELEFLRMANLSKVLTEKGRGDELSKALMDFCRDARNGVRTFRSLQIRKVSSIALFVRPYNTRCSSKILQNWTYWSTIERDYGDS